MKLSVIILSLDGHPRVTRAFLAHPEVEVVDVTGVRPVGKARNEGLERAHGDYIAWIDGDDEVTEDYLPSILGALSGNPDIAVIGHILHLPDETFARVWRGGNLLKDLLRDEEVFSYTVDKIIRRSLWEGLSFGDDGSIMEDWAIMPAVVSRAKSVIAIPKPLYIYYYNPSSASHINSIHSKEELFRRVLARADDVRRLGLEKEYAKDAFVGIASAVYGLAESIHFSMNQRDPRVKSLYVKCISFLLRNLPRVLLSSARRAAKEKILLAVSGQWWAVKWYYRNIYHLDYPPKLEWRNDTRKVHVVLAADENYRPALEVAKLTMLANCSDPSRLVIHEFDAHAMDHVDTTGFRPWNGSFMTYLRLFLPDLLPDVDTVIYSDVDTIWNRDVLELGALADPNVSAQWVHDFESVARSPGYGCAGVCVLNLRKLRERGFVSEVRRYFAENGIPPHPDQDALNDILKDDSSLLSPVWNDMGNIMNLPPKGEKSVWHITGIGRRFDKPAIAWPPQYALWHRVASRGTGNKERGTERKIKFLVALWPMHFLARLLLRGKLRERVGRNLYFAKILSDYLSEHKQ